jgi:DNA-binding transcriptional LysR family regulator
MLDGAAAAADVTLRHAVTVPGFLDVISLVRAGVGVGLLPFGVLPADDPALVAKRLTEPTLSMSVTLMTLRSRQLTPAASSFIRLTLDHVARETEALEAGYASAVATR